MSSGNHAQGQLDINPLSGTTVVNGIDYIGLARLAQGITLTGVADPTLAGQLVTIKVASQNYTATIAGDGSWSANITGLGNLPDSSYTFNAKVGSQSTAQTANLTFALDTHITAPTAALVQDSGTSASDGITNNAALAFNAADADATRVITVDGTKVAAYDPAALADGAHTVIVTDTDLAGNTASKTVSFTLDTHITAPTAALVQDSGASASDGITNNAALAFNAADADATRVITVDGTKVAAYDPAALADGAHTVTVTDTDLAGNTASTSVGFTLDTHITAPTVALVKDSGASATDGLTNSAALAFNTADADATRVITVDGTVVTAYDPAALKDGIHTVTVTDTDLAGNTAGSAVTYTLDATAPVVIASGSGGLTNKTTQTISGTVTDANIGGTVSLFDGSSQIGSATVGSDGKWVAKITLSGDGLHGITAQDTDLAGNVGTSAAVNYTLDTTGPTLSNVHYNDAANKGKNGYISWTGTDASGVDHYVYWIDGETTQHTTTGTTSMVYGNAALNTHQFHLVGVDSLGNTSAQWNGYVHFA